MDMKEFKNLVRKIDKEIRSIYGQQRFTYLDYEFTAMRLVEDLNLPAQIKRDLRVKFSNKAKQMYFDARAKNFDNISLMDRYDFFGEEEKPEKLEPDDPQKQANLIAMDEMFQAMMEDKESREPSIEEIEKLSQEEESEPEISDEDDELEQAYREVIEEQERMEKELNKPIPYNEIFSEDNTEIIKDVLEDDVEIPLEDLTDEELKEILDEVDDIDDDEIPF